MPTADDSQMRGVGHGRDSAVGRDGSEGGEQGLVLGEERRRVRVERAAARHETDDALGVARHQAALSLSAGRATAMKVGGPFGPGTQTRFGHRAWTSGLVSRAEPKRWMRVMPLVWLAGCSWQRAWAQHLAATPRTTTARTADGRDAVSLGAIGLAC